MNSPGQVETALARLPRFASLNAVIRSLPEQARCAAARSADAAAVCGPLHGIPVSLKDNIDLAGVPTTAGSIFFGAEPAQVDAAVSARVRAAGAVFVAKDNMAEWAIGATSRNQTFGDCRNPWNPACIPGGSSGGSAVAVATGTSTLALGTDTGGSVRIPASICGVTGLRPTQGRVSNRGVQPVATSFDTVGPIARDARLVAETMAVLDQYDPLDPTAVGGARADVRALLDTTPETLRIGIPEHYFFDGVDPAVRKLVRDAVQQLGQLGATTQPVTIPGAENAQQYMTEILYPEAVAFHRERLATRARDFDPDVLRRLQIGQRTAPERTEQAQQWRSTFQHNLDQLFTTVDVVVSPTIPIDVPRHADVDLVASIRELARLTYPWAMYGGPAITIPCGAHPSSGLPVGLQLAAAPWREDLLLHVATAYQRRTSWHQRRPPERPHAGPDAQHRPLENLR